MRSGVALCAAITIALGSTAIAASPKPQTVHNTIEFEGREWAHDPADRVTVGEFLGKTGLHVHAGPTDASVYLPDVEFQDGTIDFDIASPGRLAPGIGFRGQDDGGWCNTILFSCRQRPDEGGERTVEQVVVTRRARTVLLLNIRVPLHDSAGTRQFPYDWYHVKVVVQGDNVQVHLNGSEEPSIEVGSMFNAKEKGTLGFCGGDFYFTNFRYTTPE